MFNFRFVTITPQQNDQSSSRERLFCNGNGWTGQFKLWICGFVIHNDISIFCLLSPPTDKKIKLHLATQHIGGSLIRWLVDTYSTTTLWIVNHNVRYYKGWWCRGWCTGSSHEYWNSFWVTFLFSLRLPTHSLTLVRITRTSTLSLSLSFYMLARERAHVHTSILDFALYRIS